MPDAAIWAELGSDWMRNAMSPVDPRPANPEILKLNAESRPISQRDRISRHHAVTTTANRIVASTG
jgi:hypothetical protein